MNTERNYQIKAIYKLNGKINYVRLELQTDPPT